VTSAKSGNIFDVVFTSAILLLIVIVAKVFGIITGIAYSKSVSQALHKCKAHLYRQFFSNPLHTLYSFDQGESIEKLNDDFNTVTGIDLSLYPDFWTGTATAVIYFAFLASQSPFIAVALLAIALFQIIPPVIIKKYMQVNYDRTRDIEARLTNLIIEGYRGFATIKLYNLKSWYLNKMKLSEWFMSEDVKRNKISGTDIILADVSFSYNDKAILKNADVIIDCSKINIIKGANGIGKSTLFKLITGLLQCKTGTITVGNVTPETICEEEFSKSIFYLPQRDAFT